MSQKRPLSASFVLSEPRSNYYPPSPPPFPLSSPPPLRVLLRREEGPSAPVAMETNHLFVDRKAPAQLRRGKGGRNWLLICPPVLRRERLITQVCASPHLQKDTRSKRVLSPPHAPNTTPKTDPMGKRRKRRRRGGIYLLRSLEARPAAATSKEKGGGRTVPAGTPPLLSYTYVAALLRRRRH